MAIEETLDRLATNIALLTGAVATLAEAANGTYAGKPIYAQDGAAPPASSPPAADKPATARRGRGRPVVGEEPTAAPATAAAAVEATADPFAEPAATPVAPTATLDEVRAALTGLGKATTQEIALGVLKDVGKASNLTELQKTPALYGAVAAAAKAKMPIVPETPGEADPFAEPPAAPAAAPAAEKAYSLEDVKAACVAAQKTAGAARAQKVIVDAGGVAGNPPQVSLKTLSVSKYGEVIAALAALPKTM